MEAIIAWQEDGSGATGSVGTSKLFVVPAGSDVNVKGVAVAEFDEDGSDAKKSIQPLWIDETHLKVKLSHFTPRHQDLTCETSGKTLYIAYEFRQ